MQSTNFALYVFSNILLVSVLISNSKTKSSVTGDKIFNLLLMTTIFMLLFDLFGRFDGLDYSFYPFLNHVGNFVLFSLNPALSILWFLYIHYQIYSNDRAIKRYFIYAIPLLIFNTILVVGSLFSGWLYHINEFNIYSRGPIYLIPESINMLILFSTFVMLYIERKRFIKPHYYAYQFFGIIPIIALVLQSLFYGISFTLNAVALSIIILYISVQNKRMKSDYLTGTFNRRQLDYYIEDKIRASKNNKPFTAILVDLDDFKKINDSLGHPVGDEALIHTARLIKESIGREDFLARYGGDEFYVITSHYEISEIESIISRIKNRFAEFNQINERYKLDSSIGYFIYDPKSQQTMHEFQADVDMLMYQKKHAKKNQ